MLDVYSCISGGGLFLAMVLVRELVFVVVKATPIVSLESPCILLSMAELVVLF